MPVNSSNATDIVFRRILLVLKTLLVAAIYFGLALASLQLSFQNSNATPVWPPSGFAFALLLVYGLSMAPGIFLGAASVNLYFLLTGSTPPVPAALIALLTGAGNTAEAVVGFMLLKRFIPDFQLRDLFRKVRHLFYFITVAVVMCVVSSVIGTTSIFLGGIIQPKQFFSVLFTWWTGDVSGVLLVAPFVISWYVSEKKFVLPPPAVLAEHIFCITGILLMTGMVFLDWFDPSFVFTRAFFIIPFVIWAALRLNLQFVTTTLIIYAFMAISGTVAGFGPFVSPSLNQSLITSEAFISINSVMVLVLYAATRERKEKEISLRNVNENLEKTVLERTDELTRLNAVLAEAQRLAHIGSWRWDIEENKIVWSDELRRIYGLADDLPLRLDSYFQFIHEDDQERVKNIVENAMRDLQPYSFYHRIQRHDGMVRIIYGQGEVVCDAEGNPIRMQGIAQDVTEAKSAEDLLKQKSDELKEKNLELERKNQELASFNFAASHDLQEPLRKIHTFTERILQKEKNLSDYSQQLFGRIQHATVRMKTLIEDLLYYASVGTETKNFVPVDLKDILHDVETDLQEKIAETGAKIKADNLQTIQAIPSQIYHVMLNIISNSVKFKKPDQSPEIHVSTEIVHKDLIGHSLPDGPESYHHIMVSDNGIGFDSSYGERIFEIFQRLHGHAEYPGTGLGLAICKKIITSHGGIIRAEGTPGTGTKVHIFLPLLPAEKLRKDQFHAISSTR